MADQETRTFVFCDDNSDNYFNGRFTRSQNELKPEYWALKIGDYIATTDSRGIMRWL
jgi:hypothetical protein